MGRNRKIRKPEEEAFAFGLMIGVEQGIRTEDRYGELHTLNIGRVKGHGYVIRDAQGNVFSPMQRDDAIRYFMGLMEELGMHVMADD